MNNKRHFWNVPPPTPKELRNYGLLMAAVGAAAAAALWWYAENEAASWWTAGIALVFLGTGLIWPAALRPLYRVWMTLAAVLGYVNTHILLALIFYTLFTVTGSLMRLFGRDALALKGFQRRSGGRRGGNGEATYWVRRERPLLPADHFEHQF